MSTYEKFVHSNTMLQFEYDCYLVYASNNNITLILPDTSTNVDGINYIITRIDLSNNKVFIMP